MSLVINAADDYVIRTTGLPTTTGTFTICGHAKRTTDRGAYSWIFYLPRYASVASDLGLRTDSNGDDLRGFANYGTETSSVATITDSSWFFWAVTGNSTTYTLYYQKEGGSWATPQTLTQTAFAPERLILGDTQGLTPFIGEIADVRVWNAVLDATQLQAERASPTPVVTSGLLSNHPFKSATEGTALADTTAGSYNFTKNGSPSFTTAGPTYASSSSDPTLAGSLQLPKGQVSSAASPPTLNAASSITSYSLTLSCNSVSGATSYAWYVATTSGGTKVLLGETTSPSFAVSRLPTNTTRYYYVVAKKAGSPDSGYSNEVSATTKRLYARVYATPSAANVSGVTVKVWRAPSSASDIVGDVVGGGTITWGAASVVAALGESACSADLEVSQPSLTAQGNPASPITNGEVAYFYAEKGTANTGKIGKNGVFVEV